MKATSESRKPAAQSADEVVKRRWSFKAAVLGDSGVGKTWLVETALTSRDVNAEGECQHQPFQQQHQAPMPTKQDGHGDVEDKGTIGVTFNLAKLEVDGSTVLLQLWDTSGKDRYRGLLANYMTDLSCVIIVYNPCQIAAELCCQSLANWHQFALESSCQSPKNPWTTGPPMFCVVAIGGTADCPKPQTCDHFRCLAVGRAFADTVRGRFFHCRRGREATVTDKIEWIGGPKLTTSWLGGELLRRHFGDLARSLEGGDAAEKLDSGRKLEEPRGCCQRLVRSLYAITRWPGLAAFLLSRRIMPPARQ